MASLAHHYRIARQQFADLGVDTDSAIDHLKTISVSLPCWQGDDVNGFEEHAIQGGGILATGTYPGRARSPDELRADLDAACSLIPGPCRVNLHAMYLEQSGSPVDRDEIRPEHFERWLHWAQERGYGIDFNPTFFAHRLAEDGFTLTAHDEKVRQFWIDHGIASRRIAAHFGRSLDGECINNVWIPDGYKDFVVDRKRSRERLEDSLNAIFAERFQNGEMQDCVESKLFGIGSETFVPGSHEFYLGYAIQHGTMLCLDQGHFHPTESIADKISSILRYVRRLLLHLSRGVRWDSDHVVVQNDETTAVAQEVVRGGYLDRVAVGLDYFDASIHRVAAWVIGARAALQSFLKALLEPIGTLRKMEQSGDFTARLAFLEHQKELPWGIIWNEYCTRQNVPVGWAWFDVVRRYEEQVTSRRAGAIARGSRLQVAELS
ncbi:L-rhamnose isomerase [Planctomicrobium sp. SH661]|uniref:L-rhamnose isomerase n=1 Tax=Planctomicrobium sp. SH661 TaxID=3448124 RepID=UPI003F5C3AB4